MGMIDKTNADQMDKNLSLEINPNHEIIVKLNELRKTNISIGIVIL